MKVFCGGFSFFPLYFKKCSLVYFSVFFLPMHFQFCMSMYGFSKYFHCVILSIFVYFQFFGIFSSMYILCYIEYFHVFSCVFFLCVRALVYNK